MRRDDVKELARLCALEEWRKVKEMADSFAADEAGPARFFQAISRLHLGEYLGAWFCCERALGDIPDSAELLDLSGRICASLGDAEASKVFHDCAIRHLEPELQAALTFNYASSMARLGEWAAVSEACVEYGDTWESEVRNSLLIGAKIAGNRENLDKLLEIANEIHARSPHAPILAQRLHLLGATEEADLILQRCFLTGNEAAFAANRVLLWLSAGNPTKAFEIWRAGRDEIRSMPAFAATLQALVLVSMGSEDAALKLLEGNRRGIRENRFLAVRDAACVTHSELLERADNPRAARRVLVEELQSTGSLLERVLTHLRTFSRPGLSGVLSWWEVAFDRDGDHRVRVKVSAPSSESARVLAIEVLPQSLQTLPLSVCRLADEPSSEEFGVFEREIGYRVSRDILSEIRMR